MERLQRLFADIVRQWAKEWQIDVQRGSKCSVLHFRRIIIPELIWNTGWSSVSWKWDGSGGDSSAEWLEGGSAKPILRSFGMIKRGFIESRQAVMLSLYLQGNCLICQKLARLLRFQAMEWHAFVKDDEPDSGLRNSLQSWKAWLDSVWLEGYAIWRIATWTDWWYFGVDVNHTLETRFVRADWTRFSMVWTAWIQRYFTVSVCAWDVTREHI